MQRGEARSVKWAVPGKYHHPDAMVRVHRGNNGYLGKQQNFSGWAIRRLKELYRL